MELFIAGGGRGRAASISATDIRGVEDGEERFLGEWQLLINFLTIPNTE